MSCSEVKEGINWAIELLVSAQKLAIEVNILIVRFYVQKSARERVEQLLRGARVQLENIKTAERHASASFEELEDPGQEVQYALFGLEGHYGDQPEVIEELHTIENPPFRGGHYNSTDWLHFFFDLSARQQELIREAIAHRIYELTERIRDYEKRLLNLSNSAGLGGNICILQTEVASMKEEARVVIDRANSLEAQLWIERFERDFEGTIADYMDLYAWRYRVYEDNGRFVGQPLTKYVTPNKPDGKTPLVDYDSSENGRLMALLLSNADFCIWHGVLFRPFGKDGRIALVTYWGDISKIQGYLDNLGTFTDSGGEERF